MYCPVKQYKVIKKDLEGLRIKDFFKIQKQFPILKNSLSPPRAKFITKIIPCF